jgi:ApbE superfamily uncharacterized protein (UPF0280 family)
MAARSRSIDAGQNDICRGGACPARDASDESDGTTGRAGPAPTNRSSRAGPVGRFLPDGRRLHLQHGPIDLVIEAWGERAEIETAYRQAWARFQDVLEGLVAELPLLRRPADAAHPGVRGPVAKRMLAACRQHEGVFLTPMAAVAGAVADEVLAAMLAGRTLEKAYVNDGGDIALHLAPGTRLRTGIVGDLAAPVLDAVATIDAAMPVRGIATSGAGGRSFSLGIADAVTVLARDAASADAAATVIGNEVDLDHPSVERAPAFELDPDSDLGERLVTIGVGDLAPAEIALALDRGAAEAERIRHAGLIHAAVLLLKGEARTVGADALRLGHGEKEGDR